MLVCLCSRTKLCVCVYSCSLKCPDVVPLIFFFVDHCWWRILLLVFLFSDPFFLCLMVWSGLVWHRLHYMHHFFPFFSSLCFLYSLCICCTLTSSACVKRFCLFYLSNFLLRIFTALYCAVVFHFYFFVLCFIVFGLIYRFCALPVNG